MKTTKYDLEERLIEFGSRAVDVAESLPQTPAGKHFGSQLVRSGTAPALNYGEAQAAESRPDFIHKMSSGVYQQPKKNYPKLTNKPKPLSHLDIGNSLLDIGHFLSSYCN